MTGHNIHTINKNISTVTLTLQHIPCLHSKRQLGRFAFISEANRKRLKLVVFPPTPYSKGEEAQLQSHKQTKVRKMLFVDYLLFVLLEFAFLYVVRKLTQG